jgi:hypothetical protein
MKNVYKAHRRNESISSPWFAHEMRERQKHAACQFFITAYHNLSRPLLAHQCISPLIIPCVSYPHSLLSLRAGSNNEKHKSQMHVCANTNIFFGVSLFLASRGFAQRLIRSCCNMYVCTLLIHLLRPPIILYILSDYWTNGKRAARINSEISLAPCFICY